MPFTLVRIIILAIVQGLAELLPVSSSAHVIVAEKLMGIDPSSPEATLLLVLLHTGTMFAVIVYFWSAWRRAFFSSRDQFVLFVKQVLTATIVTGIIGLVLKFVIEKILMRMHPDAPKAEVEQLFNHLELLAASLAAAGVLILFAGMRSRPRAPRRQLNIQDSIQIGAVQGLCLLFRGFSRSGATISVGLIRNLARGTAEEFSFALAVVLTPVVVLMEARRLFHHDEATASTSNGMHMLVPGLLGMLFSFLAGLVALRVLSRLLERGQWWLFGVYCLFAAGVVFVLYQRGY